MTDLPELKPCPFCGGAGEIADHRYQGTGASGMETPEPFARCKAGCVTMPKVYCTDWPYGKGKLPTYKQAREQAIAAWNTRTGQLVERAGVGQRSALALGDRVEKIKGSCWTGRVVGFYRTELTPYGVCVESEREPGSVQIYPEAALKIMWCDEAPRALAALGGDDAD